MSGSQAHCVKVGGPRSGVKVRGSRSGEWSWSGGHGRGTRLWVKVGGGSRSGVKGRGSRLGGRLGSGLLGGGGRGWR